MKKIDRITEKEREYLDEVLKGEFSASKTYTMVTRMEQAFASKFGKKYGVAMVNGTATLHMALEAAGVEPGDEVICPPLTMSSTAISILMTNAVPVFADVDLDTFLITATEIEKKISAKTKAIITVSTYGLSPQMYEIMQLAKKHNLVVIEDNAECYGAYQDGKIVGSYGDMASYSFQSSKHITCGEGGIVITDDGDLADKLRRYSGLGYAGVSSRKGRITKDDIQSPNYERHVILGWNYRMSDLCAAVIMGQLERMEEFVKMRQLCALYYDDAIKGSEILKAQQIPTGNTNSYWTYAMKLDTDKVNWYEFRKKYVEMGGDGYYAAWKLAYQEPMFRNKAFLNREKIGIYDAYDFRSVCCPNAERLQRSIIQLKTNYYDEAEVETQAQILKKTVEYYEGKRG
ncbi:MAG: DegT/DnrJ/EryC1/StrS family aminotransferase [Eubacterium sp.]|nr:DegT/DnrJ/EryC1/StrS family aminotransferase [Eubacterium sp.]